MHEAAGRTGAQLYKKALSLIIAFAGVLALPSALLLEGKGLGYSNGFLPVCLLLLALPAIHAALWKEGALRQAGLPAFLLGLGFALATSVAVSYTHLDVYKRQALDHGHPGLYAGRLARVPCPPETADLACPGWIWPLCSDSCAPVLGKRRVHVYLL